MNVTRLGASIAIVLVAIATGSASAEDTVDRLESIERDRLRSLVDLDMEAAARLHAADFQLITPLGGMVSKDQHLGMIASGDVDYLEWEPGDIEVKLCGNMAILRYQAKLTNLVKGNPDAPSGRFWHTDVYERHEGRWQVVWSQATKIR